ncbi:MAG: LysM peptidoglycan-binding domain-containing protein [Opitutae bacterium]|jgi:LysM repeat protein|nr:LysM peptidoglycan-binding domain-containing protein [Opitutae bacterium]
MKLTKIFGIVLSLHVVVILLVMFQPGCQTVEQETPAPAPGETSKEKPAFNEGFPAPGTAQPEEAASTGSGLSNPTRPEPGGIIVPGQTPLVPAPLPALENPGPINLAPTDVTVYKVQRGDTLWAIARKNNVSLAQLLTGNPSLDKNSRLAIGQEIILPAGGSSLIQPAPVVPSVSVPVDGSSYVVQAGDSLSRIAGAKGVSLNALFQANGLTKSSIIRPGQVLTIPGGAASAVVPSPSPTVVPVGAITHVVKNGDNLTRISAIYGTTVKQIMEWNNLADAGKLSIGQNLVVSDPSAVPSAPQTTAPGTADPDASLQDFFKNEAENRPVIDVAEPKP